MCKILHCVKLYTQLKNLHTEYNFPLYFTLRCFVARHLLSQIYALSSVKFLGLKLQLCKKRDKYEVTCSSDQLLPCLENANKLGFSFSCHHGHCDHHHWGVLKVRHEFGFSNEGWAPMPVICLMTAELLALC